MDGSWLAAAGFVFQAVFLSLSGVISPGAMTAAALAAGTKNRHAGALMAVGHGVIELPLMLIILAVANRAAVLGSPSVKACVSIVGGLVLGLMAVMMLRSAPQQSAASSMAARVAKSPFTAGIILTAGNPMFLTWWAAAGLGLTLQTASLGLGAFAAFAAIHWICDLIWLEFLTFATFSGAWLMGPKAQRILLLACGLAMLAFGIKFIVEAGIFIFSSPAA